MSFCNRPPNRLFSFEDLEDASFQRILQQMDALLEKEEISYLHPSKRWEYPWALERAELASGSRVLDAGCGASIFPIYLASTKHRTTAFDVQVPRGLDRLHGVFVQYIQGDLAALPLADSCFDAIFCISVIEHLGESSVLSALQELKRVLRPGGRLLLTTDYYEDAEAPLWYEGPDRRFRVDWKVFDRARLQRLLDNAIGFEVEGDLDLAIDWHKTREEMRRFHGYPYTSVGIALKKN